MPARPRSCHCCLLGPSPACYDLPHATTNHLCQPPVHPAVACHPAPRTLALQSLCCCAELPRLQTPLKLLFSDSCRASPPLAQLRPLERRGCLSQEDAIKGAWQTRWQRGPAARPSTSTGTACHWALGRAWGQVCSNHRLACTCGRYGLSAGWERWGRAKAEACHVCQLGRRGAAAQQPQLAVRQHAALSANQNVMSLHQPAGGRVAAPPRPHLCCACRAGGT